MYIYIYTIFINIYKHMIFVTINLCFHNNLPWNLWTTSINFWQQKSRLLVSPCWRNTRPWLGRVLRRCLLWSPSEDWELPIPGDACVIVHLHRQGLAVLPAETSGSWWTSQGLAWKKCSRAILHWTTGDTRPGKHTKSELENGHRNSGIFPATKW